MSEFRQRMFYPITADDLSKRNFFQASNPFVDDAVTVIFIKTT